MYFCLCYLKWQQSWRLYLLDVVWTGDGKLFLTPNLAKYSYEWLWTLRWTLRMVMDLDMNLQNNHESKNQNIGAFLSLMLCEVKTQKYFFLIDDIWILKNNERPSRNNSTTIQTGDRNLTPTSNWSGYKILMNNHKLYNESLEWLWTLHEFLWMRINFITKTLVRLFPHVMWTEETEILVSRHS